MVARYLGAGCWRNVILTPDPWVDDPIWPAHILSNGLVNNHAHVFRPWVFFLFQSFFSLGIRATKYYEIYPCLELYPSLGGFFVSHPPFERYSDIPGSFFWIRSMFFGWVGFWQVRFFVAICSYNMVLWWMLNLLWGCFFWPPFERYSCFPVCVLDNGSASMEDLAQY